MSITKCLSVLSVLILTAIFANVLPAAENDIVLKSDTFEYRLGQDGKNVAFTLRDHGKNILRTATTAENSYAAWIEKDGKVVVPSGVQLVDHTLRYRFADSGMSASVRIVNKKNRLLFEVTEVTGKPDKFVFVNIPLTLEAKPYEPVAVCLLALNDFTRVRQLPALNNECHALCDSRFRVTGAATALVCVNQSEIIPAIRETMTTDAPSIPRNEKGGAWALDSPDGYGSYMINYSDLTEKTVDDWIANCRKLGFTQIDNHGGKPEFFHFGSLDINKKNFPEGWKSFRKIVDRLHAAGISSILHTYAGFVGMQSRYVTPVAHDDLYQLATFTLAKPLSKDATEVEVNEPITGPYRGSGLNTIKVGGEIIRYKSRTTKAPYRFTGCTRGWHDTHVTAHAKGEKVGILGSCFLLYVAAPESKLWYEIIQNHVDVMNEGDFDGLYFDAIEGYYHLWGDDDYWYYGGRFVMEIARRLKKPVGMEYAGMIHSWWHYRSRYQAWDAPSRGYKRFLDIHIAAMKAGEEYQHGSWMKEDALVDKYANMKGCSVYLPLQLGWWWRFPAWGRPNEDPTYSDDIEYICCKLLGNNAGFSCNVDPTCPEWNERIRQYEELRHGKYFDESVLARLRQPRREFELIRQGDRWNFRPMFYRRHKVTDLAHDPAKWSIENEFDSQDVKLRVTPLYTIAPYDSPEGKTILCADDINKTILNAATAPGVTRGFKQGTELVPATKEKTIEYTATNDGTADPVASWACILRNVPGLVDDGSSKKLALGVWIYGDGQGEILDFRLGGLSHFVTIDFTGWKYCELLEPESNEITQCRWRECMYVVYNYYSTFGKKIAINPLQIWYNNIPAGKTVRCLIGPVKLLPYSDNEIKNPAISVNGTTITFPLTMKSGMFLEFKGKDHCKLYAPDRKFLNDVAVPDTIPVLKKGKNEILFSCEPTQKTSTRVEVTVIGQGKPF